MNKGLWLVICGTDPRADALAIKEGPNVIGRGKGCDIHLPHPEVSWSHAILVKDNGRLSIRDLGSENGTFLDGKPVRSATIKAGSSLRIGRVAFDVVDHLPKQSSPEDDEEETDRGAVHDPGDAAFRAAQLPPARKRVLQFLLQGYAEKHIAYQLGASDHVVHRHLKKIYKSFGVHSRAALCAYFRENGMMPAEQPCYASDKTARSGSTAHRDSFRSALS